MNSTADLLAALGAHLVEFELPTIASVHVAATRSRPQVTVQLSRGAPSALTQALLAWADTLTEVTAQAWRVPNGERVHLSVTGHLPGRESLRVYGGAPFAQHGIGADLAPSAATTIRLVALRHLATPGDVAV
ncbi:MAG: hypothetical protein M3460_08460 [Actinomycetota bacterium]|nr:hypothetical protein [Actinomycetota bacterium]